MTARVLVVDDVAANVKLLEARLSAEYFDVITAMSGEEALAICERAECDLVLLDVMMPDMDGFEVCRRLKTNPATHHIPVVMVTALDQPSDRVRGLEAGADDFLTKPVPDLALIARVRSLARLKMMTDELRMRAVTSREIGIGIAGARGGRRYRPRRPRAHRRRSAGLARAHRRQCSPSEHERRRRGRSERGAVPRRRRQLRPAHRVAGAGEFRRAAAVQPDPLARPHPQRADPGASPSPTDNARMVRGLEIGVNDYLMRPIDKNELLARARSQVRKRRYTERLRDNVQISIEMAITDALTGLYNRRYMESHLATLVEQASARGKPLAVLVLDIDYFKSINDTHGHDAGDDVLREFALRIKRSIRGIDLACRYGGEEFVVVMPETDMAVAAMVAERLRRRIAAEPFRDPPGRAQHSGDDLDRHRRACAAADDNAAGVLKRADQALYRAKRDGRNRVVPDAA